MLKSQPVKKVEVEFPKSHSINLLNWLQSSSNSSLLQLCSRNVQHYSEYNWICSVFTKTKKLTYKQIQKKLFSFTKNFGVLAALVPKSFSHYGFMK